MVKAVVGDETQLTLAEDRLSQSGLTSQVGLVIGKLSSTLDRGFVYDLIPTPPNDAGHPACSLLDTNTSSFKSDKKKAPKSKSQAPDSSTLVIDKQWVAEHARQVSRMLLGGMNVVGIYVWVGDSLFKNSTVTLSQLLQTVKEVADAAPISQTDWDERLLIHICYSPRRWTCRNCVLSSNITSSSIRPCDFKMGKVLNSVQTFKCTYNFELSVPICHENTTDASTLSATLRRGISVHAKELGGAKALIDGNWVVDDEPCVSEGPHEVELLLPFMKNTFAEACRQRDVIGVLLFSGSVSSFAYSNSKESVSQAVADIKDDIIRSLQSRLDIICDEADEDVGSVDDDSVEGFQEKPTQKPISRLVLSLLRKRCTLTFPRRVFIPWLAGTYICDYLQQSETLEVVKDHCVELMCMRAPSDDSVILQPEVEAASLLAKSFWDVAVPSHSASSFISDKSGTNNASGVVSEGTSSGSFNFNIVAAFLFLLHSFNFSILAVFLFLLLAILIGFVLVRMS
ncbi:oxidoreductase zinc-binding dehydrogenase family protein [Euphorbia peplus]|nr:oxidoreductase zinc-binding dehydrogenase family protein [Euphorbia peplus]